MDSPDFEKKQVQYVRCMVVSTILFFDFPNVVVCKNNVFMRFGDFPCSCLKCFCDKQGVQGSIFGRIFESSKNDPVLDLNPQKPLKIH